MCEFAPSRSTVTFVTSTCLELGCYTSGSTIIKGRANDTQGCVCRIEVSQSRREIDARRTAKRARERLPHPISRPRPRLVQASASLPTLLRSFGGTGGRCLRAVRKRECLNNSSEFVNDLYPPAFPSLE